MEAQDDHAAAAEGRIARCPFAEWLPSPNFTPGWITPPRTRIQHSTVGTWGNSLAELQRPDADPVSAHFLLGLDGRIGQLVDTANRAWHARSANDFGFGLEYVDDGRHWDAVRTPEQYAAGARVNAWLARTHNIPNVAGTIDGHRIYVATACPSGLDLERIIRETVGGSMGFDPRNVPADLAWLDARIREIMLGEPHLTASALKRALTPYYAAPAKATKQKRPTRAQVRAGHGKG